MVGVKENNHQQKLQNTFPFHKERLDFWFQCATRICYKTVQRNRDYVQRYQVDHETGSTFPCFFHPSAVVNDGAVLRKTIHWSLAVHVILWPSFGILAGISTCGYTYYWKRRKRKQYDFGDSSNAQLEDDTRITDPYNNWERYWITAALPAFGFHRKERCARKGTNSDAHDFYEVS